MNEVHSAKSGPWNSPDTWVEGVIPDSKTVVIIRSGHAVTFEPEFRVLDESASQSR